eukprot:TRINITY_DN14245_c0_g2_i1.p1 TRINITY_DN14245_c0_g2~~TRINITY_DN14245_c0_g2_i1.p1  ORF type:complete len:1688 (+),score=775.19 TRINITY_DN14245_c0_g2_i1:53-5065(+)
MADNAGPDPANDGGGGNNDDGGKRKNKDLQQIGMSVYIRKKVRQTGEDGKAKTKTFWVLEGKTFDDKEFVWEERRAKEGYIQYRNASTHKSARTLPDMGPTKSTFGGKGETAVNPKRVKAEPLDGWNPERKALIQGFIKKKLSKYAKEGIVTSEGQKILVKNVADSYMSQNPSFTEDFIPADVENSLAFEAREALDDWLRVKSQVEYSDLSFLDPSPLDTEAALPDKPEKDPPAPVSPFLPRANYLRDPYYYQRLDYANPRRSELEEDLEAKLFFNPGLGEVKVVAAVKGWICHPSDPKENQPAIIAVVRDWVNAHCLAYIQAPNDVSPDFTILGIHPLTDCIEMGKLLGKQHGSEILRGIVMLDDQRHVLGFKDADDHKYLDLMLKLGMCSMMSQGSDDEKICKMRAHAVEFAWNHTQPIPHDSAEAKFNLLVSAKDSELDQEGDGDREVDKLVDDLRMYMLGAENRDSILRKWVELVKRNKHPTSAQIQRQLRVIEEAIRFPAPTNDPFLHDGVAAGLGQLQLELARMGLQGDSIPFNITPSRLINLWKILTGCIQDFRSREVHPDQDYDRYCEPAPNSEAADLQRLAMDERRRNYEPDQLPPGVYLSALVYCGDDLLTDAHHNLPSEVIKEGGHDDIMRGFTRDSDDFMWVLKHGSDPDWADHIQVYSQVFDNSGTGRFRALFIDAAKRLQIQLGRSDLGIVFDNVVVQEEVNCVHIVTVLRLAKKDDVPVHTPIHLGWDWRPSSLVEYTTYLKAFQIRASCRVAFMPATYNNCQRWIYSAIQYKEAQDSKLLPGVYFGYFGACPRSNGFEVMVSETHRHLIPLARIQADFPTLEDWRWVQCLSEKKRRIGSYEWHTISTTVTAASQGREVPTFRHRFLRAALELEATVGREIEHIYDFEILNFDEAGTVKIIAVGERLLQRPPVHEPPPNTTPVGFKNWEMVEASYFHLMWPHMWGLYGPAHSAADAGQLRICQPFAADEALRLAHDGALSHLLDVEAMVLPLRWMWTLWVWSCNGYPTIVSEHEGSVDKSIVRSIEVSVETAVANHATQQDINELTAKSIAMDAPKHSDWDTLYVKIREVHRTMKNGYQQRVQKVPPKGAPVIKERTWDELYSDEDDDEDGIERPPTVYHMDCTIEELVEKDGADAQGGPNVYFEMQSIVKDIVELSLIESVDASTIRVCGQVLNDMITILEFSDTLVDDAVVLTLKEQAVDNAVQENQSFKKAWFDIFSDHDEGILGNVDGDIGSDFDEDEVTRFGHAPLYQQGSSAVINSTEQGLRVCMAKAMNSVQQCEQLLKTIASAQEAAELTDCIADYDTAVAKQVSIIKETVGRNVGSPLQPVASTPGQSPYGASVSPSAYGTPMPEDLPQALVMVSNDNNEFPLDHVDAGRSLALGSASGKIRFGNTPSHVLSVVAAYMLVSDEDLPAFLQDLASRLRGSNAHAGDVLALAVQLKAPYLALAAGGLAYGTLLPGAHPSQPQYAFNQDTGRGMWTAVEAGLVDYGLRDWSEWGARGGPAIAPAMDVAWWGRYLRETPKEEAVTAYTDHEGLWEQMYAETRVKSMLMGGADAIEADELALWRAAFGRLVEYVSLRETTVGDGEVEVLTSCCPNVKSLDLAHTAVTDTTAGLLVGRFPKLIDLNIDGTVITPGLRQRLSSFVAANQRAFG